MRWLHHAFIMAFLTPPSSLAAARSQRLKRPIRLPLRSLRLWMLPQRKIPLHSSVTSAEATPAIVPAATICPDVCALADATALSVVWRWLVEDVGADQTASDFQSHLQGNLLALHLHGHDDD